MTGLWKWLRILALGRRIDAAAVRSNRAADRLDAAIREVLNSDKCR